MHPTRSTTKKLQTSRVTRSNHEFTYKPVWSTGLIMNSHDYDKHSNVVTERHNSCINGNNRGSSPPRPNQSAWCPP